MRVAGLLVVTAVVAGTGVLFWLTPGPRDDTGDPSKVSAPTVEAEPSQAPLDAIPAATPPDLGIERLRTEKNRADTRVAAAEARINDLEQQVELLEVQIYDIEASGDDPADRAEEVLPYLRPVLAEFLDAQAELDAALDAQARADAALTEALAGP